MTLVLDPYYTIRLSWLDGEFGWLRRVGNLSWRVAGIGRSGCGTLCHLGQPSFFFYVPCIALLIYYPVLILILNCTLNI